MTVDTENKIAVLIDAENISYLAMDDIFTEIKSNGNILISRIYGCYNNISNWKDICNKYSITIKTQFQNVTGKNTSDSSLIIDAMDILYTKDIDTFYIVSSDSDYTGLITRIKEDNKLVVGIGEKKTPSSLINACNKFIFIENLGGKAIPVASNTKVATKDVTKEKNISSITPIDQIRQQVYKIIEASDGKAILSQIKSKLTSVYSEFDVKNYEGMPTKFSSFLVSLGHIKVTKNGKENYAEYTKEETPQQAVDLPDISVIRDLMMDIIKNDKDQIINTGMLNIKIKEKYPKFTFKHYGAKSSIEFVKKLDKYFKFVDKKKNNVTLV